MSGTRGALERFAFAVLPFEPFDARAWNLVGDDDAGRFTFRRRELDARSITMTVVSRDEPVL